MKPVPMSAGTTRKVPPQGYLMSTPPAVKPRRLYSASSTPGSAQKTPQRLSVGGHAHLRLPPPAPPGACACWHGKQAPPSASMRVAWQPPSPYLEDLTKTLVIAPPIRRKLQLVQTVRLKAGAPSPYEPPRETSSRARNYLRAQLQAELDERHDRILWEREAAIAASELGMDVHTYHSLLSMQHRDITPEDYEVLTTLDSSLKPKTLSKSVMDERMPAWTVPARKSSRRSLQKEFDLAGPDGEAAAVVADQDDEDDEDDEEEPTCSICLCELLAGEVVRTLPCKHSFHAQCIETWLTENSHCCPADGLPVLPDEERG